MRDDLLATMYHGGVLSPWHGFSRRMGQIKDRTKEIKMI